MALHGLAQFTQLAFFDFSRATRNIRYRSIWRIWKNEKRCIALAEYFQSKMFSFMHFV